MNAYTHWARHFLKVPERPFLEDESGATLSYADLDRETARIAAWLCGLGLEPGARVAAQIDKSPQGIFLYLGTMRAGFCFLPLNTAYQAGELGYFLKDAEPGVVVCRPTSLELFESLSPKGTRVFTLDEVGGGTLSEALQSVSVGDRGAEERTEHRATGHRATEHRATEHRGGRDRSAYDHAVTAKDDPAVIIYTSGTTGRSKGAVVTHGNLTSNADVLAEHWRFTAGDALIHALPMFHVHGLFVALHPVLCASARLLFQRKFDPRDVIRALPRATMLMGVPTFYTRLLAEPLLSRETCRSMRLFVSGSAPLLEATHREFRERTGHAILERYGMSEAGMITSNPYEGDRRAGSVGKPLPGVSLRIVSEHGQACSPGEAGGVEIQGPNVFGGYFRMPEQSQKEFTSDGFFKTGDVGVMSQDGYLSIVGRSKDIVITGGYNVYPKELELLIDAFPEVEESAVVGVDDPDFGEAVTAVIVLRAGATLQAADVVSRLKSEIAPYKVPKRVHFASALPRNAMGKVQKKSLREELARRP